MPIVPLAPPVLSPSSPTPRPLSVVPRPRRRRVGLLGLGTVGQGLVALLERRRDDLARRFGLAFEVERVLVRDVKKPRRARPENADVVSDPAAFLAGDYDVVVEAIGGIDPAARIVEEFLRRGTPVVTANKALLAERVDDLAALAASTGASLRFEASVAAGIPLVGLLDRALHSTTVGRLEAILNATSNVVLSGLSRAGLSVDESLEDARRRGFAEADARLDVSGYDAAQKLSVLVWSLSGRTLPWTRLEIRGIEDALPADAARARALGGRLKPVAVADLTGEAARGFVAPAYVPDAHPLARVEDGANGVRLSGDVVEDLFLAGPGAGGTATAASLLDDLIAIESGGDPGTPRRRAPERDPDSAAPAPLETGWFLAVPLPRGAPDAGDALAAVSRAGLRLVRSTVLDEPAGAVLVALSLAAPPQRLEALALRLARRGLAVRAFRALDAR